MKSTPRQTLYPKARVDALTDGIFAVAMTLLVLDIRIPEGYQPADAAQMLEALAELLPRFLPYAVSFLILGMRWLSFVEVHNRAEHVSSAYIRSWMIYLLLITCVPFTTMVVGRYASFAPAVWLYCANTILIALASWRMFKLTPEMDSHLLHARVVSMVTLLASCLLCIAWSLVEPRQALWAFLLNFLVPSVGRFISSRNPVDPH